MIKPTILSRYLAGDATDEESQLCEELLNEPGSVESLIGELEANPTDDSLLETLRNLENHSTQFNLENAQPKSLVEQIQSLVANQSDGQDDFDRFLAPPESSDEIGRIAHYRVIEFIASGGMGLVFKAEDSKLNRMVCIKVLKPSLATNRGAVARFEREVQAAARLRNTRITTVLEFGEHKEVPYLVMELLEGQSLRDKLTIESKFAPEVARKLTIQIAEGLRYAHQRGYLHRDIKPENIWVTPEGDVKLLDFGLTRSFEGTTNLTHSGTILGTPTYMSPEQVQGKELDAKSDLFSVGTVLFEMLTGESPFGKSNLFSTMMSVANDAITFPETTDPNSIPEDLQQLIHSLLKKSPEDRMESADQLITALTSEDGAALISKTRSKKSPISLVSVGLVGGVVGACCLALAFALYQFNDKGTLIVEADPSINVSIANEEVSIEDPQTGKRFKVAIGETPLPSGVYQLQMQDESGQYTLSSEVIAIRRGEQQIVRIELKPDSPSEAKSQTAGNKANPSKATPTLTLAELPTLSAAELKRKLNIQPGDALFRNAIVTQPPERPGVTSWSIEPAFESGAEMRINCDGSRIATTTSSEGSKVTIWNRDSQPTHIIPTQDRVFEIAWSPDPDIIAIVENGKRRQQVTVCKLFEEHLEVINVFPGEGTFIAWSWDGLLLAVQSEQGISFIDLVKGGEFAHPNFGIDGDISKHPWSKNGRFFAATVDDDVKVWDLEEKKLLHVFNGKEDGRFLPEGNEIAVNNLSGKWEIWDLDSFVRIRTLEPETDSGIFYPDPSFQRVVFSSQEGELVLKELATGSTAVCELKLDSFYTEEPDRLQYYLGRMKLDWAENGTDFLCRLERNATFVSNAEQKKNASLVDLAKLQNLMPFYKKHVYIDGSHRQRRLGLSADSQRFMYFSTPLASQLGYSEIGTFNSLDIAKMQYFPPTDISLEADSANFSLSPDGEMVAIMGTSLLPVNGVVSNEAMAESRKKIRIHSVATGKLIKSIETELVEHMIWSPDSTSLVVSTGKSIKPGRNERTERLAKQTLEKYDADKDGKLNIEEAKKLKSIFVDKNKDGLFDSDEIADSFVIKRHRSRSIELETRIYNVASGENILLQANATSDESAKEELCFQRGQFAKPVLYENQIVLPLFIASTYRNGRRSISSSREPVKLNDKLGFFDLKTGKLAKLVELNCQFTGTQLELTDKLISIGVASRERNLNIDSFIVFDRKNGNEGHLPMSHVSHSSRRPLTERLKLAQDRLSGQMKKGTPYLSPKHPLVAVSDKAQLQIWRLDSDNRTFSVVRTIRVSNKYNRDLAEDITWHPTKPIVAWIADNAESLGKTRPVVHSYDANSRKVDSYDAISLARGIQATPGGWLVVGSGKMDLLDHNFGLRKSYLSTERFENFENAGKFDQCISNEGAISNPAMNKNLRVIQLRENRIETRGIEVLKP